MHFEKSFNEIIKFLIEPSKKKSLSKPLILPKQILDKFLLIK